MKLKDLMPALGTPEEYKIHFAVRTPEGDDPLDAYKRDPVGLRDWMGWNSYSQGTDWFNRQYIFSLMRFYPDEDPNVWLFGGIWIVEEKDWNKVPFPYAIKKCSKYANLIGMLKINCKHEGKQMRNNMEKFLDSLVVKEILPEPFK